MKKSIVQYQLTINWRRIMKNLKKIRSIGLYFLSICLPILSLLWAGDAQAGYLYAGTSNPGIVYTYDGTSWTAISGDDMGFAVLDLIEFQGDLYAATMSPGKVWRYDGTGWTEVWATSSDQVCDLEVWNGDLYAGTAWDGGELYRYNAVTDTFDYVGTVPDSDSGGTTHPWYGIRAMYPWSHTGDLHLGDIGFDCLGRYDGTTMIYDAYMGGSCIYDFAEFDGKLYAAAWAGRLLWSSTGVGLDWSSQDFPGSSIWEIEPFQEYLYMGNAAGQLLRLDTSHSHEEIWSSGSYDQQICSMVADRDSMLYFGSGGEAGYNNQDSGTARVYAYDGSGTPVEIFDADGGDTAGTDHAGVQCLYLSPAIEVALDIKPTSCPNPFNFKAKGVLPAAILGTDELDVTMIDPASLKLILADDNGNADGVAPLRWAWKDVAAPYMDDVECGCTTDGPDSYMDLTVKFDNQEMADMLNGYQVGDVVILAITGNLLEEYGGTPIRGQDCVVVRQGNRIKNRHNF